MLWARTAFLTCKVTGVSEEGIDVDVWDYEAPGFIPALEAFWPQRPPDLQWQKLTDGWDRIGRGDTVTGVVVAGTGPSGHLTISRTLAMEHQWAAIGEGQMVPFTVTHFGASRLHGRIRGGLMVDSDLRAAQAALARLPAFQKGGRHEPVVTRHDTLCGVVTHKDSHSRQVHVDVALALDALAGTTGVEPWRLWVPTGRVGSLRQVSWGGAAVGRTADIGQDLPPAPATQYHQVLVVDDDESIGRKLVSFFERGGYAAHYAADLSQAQSTASQHDVDLLIQDLRWAGTNGVAWADEHIFQRIRPVDTILATTLTAPDGNPVVEGQRLADALHNARYPNRFKDLWNKAPQTRWEDLTEILNRLRDEREHSLLGDMAASAQAGPDPDTIPGGPACVIHDGIDPALQTLLEEHVEMLPTGCDAAVFALHVLSYEVRLLAGTELIQRNFGDLARDLHKSPIRDLLVDREVIDDAEAPRHEAKYRWLLHLRPGFHWIAGKEIETDDRHWAHCLFVFGPGDHAMTVSGRVAIGLIVARAEKLLLDRHLRARVRDQTALAAKGVAFEKLAHEVKAKLRNTLWALPEPRQGQSGAVRVPVEELEVARRFVNDCRAIAEEFLPDVASAAPTPLRVLGLLELLTADARRTGSYPHINVRLADVPAPGPMVAIRPVVLLRVMENLLANADHFAGGTGRHGGEVVLELLSLGDRHPRPVEIWCHDNGQGIRARHLGRIFDRFSTRGGTGYGLVICREFLNRFGGEIEVFEAILGVGSSFVIRLPNAGGGAQR